MKEQYTVVTRKGQVTIPAEIRNALGIQEGDMVSWTVEAGVVHLQRCRSVVAHTAGMLRGEAQAPSDEDEHVAVEKAIAEEVVQRSEADVE